MKCAMWFMSRTLTSVSMWHVDKRGGGGQNLTRGQMPSLLKVAQRATCISGKTSVERIQSLLESCWKSSVGVESTLIALWHNAAMGHIGDVQTWLQCSSPSARRWLTLGSPARAKTDLALCVQCKIIWSAQHAFWAMRFTSKGPWRVSSSTQRNCWIVTVVK